MPLGRLCSYAVDAEDSGPFEPGAPGVVTREDPGFAVHRSGAVPLEEHHIVVVRTGLAETVYPVLILLRHKHPVAVLARLFQGVSSGKMAGPADSAKYDVRL